MTEDRLPRLHSLCDFIGGVVTGENAMALLENHATPNSGAVIALPTWVWREPVIDVGRKGKARDGSRLLMPVRVTWPENSVIILADGETREVPWQVSGLGHRGEGTSTVTLTRGGEASIGPVYGADAALDVRLFHRKTGIRKHLTDLIRNGTDARWGLMASLEPFTLIKLETANYAVAAELSETRRDRISAVLDRIALDALLSQMLYGEGATSVISRMVDRCLAPNTFNRVDPMRYLSYNIRARAEEAVRRAIGDPKVGPKVRRLYAATQPESMDEFLAIYKRHFPQDSLAKKRAIAALTAGADPSAIQSGFNDEVFREVAK